MKKLFIRIFSIIIIVAITSIVLNYIPSQNVVESPAQQIENLNVETIVNNILAMKGELEDNFNERATPYRICNKNSDCWRVFSSPCPTLSEMGVNLKFIDIINQVRRELANTYDEFDCPLYDIPQGMHRIQDPTICKNSICIAKWHRSKY